MEGLAQANDLSEVIEADRAHMWHHLSQHKQYETVDPRIIVEGKGMRVWDAAGKEHLDAVSGGVWTVNVGYGRESIANAVRDQLIKMNYFAHSAGSIPASRFSKRLIEKMPGLSRVYYSNSGSEANEKVFKMVRQISHRHHGGKKGKILFRERDYHGTTITALATSGQPQRAEQYGPLTPGFVMVPHCLEYRKQWDVENYGERAADAIEEVILREGPDTIGALCLEPVTAGGGVIVPPAGYWERVQEICRKYDILLHIDEGGLRARPHRHLVRLSELRRETRFRHHGQGRGLGLCGHLLHGHDRGRLRHVQGRSLRSDELLPRHLHLRRLHRGPGRGAREHADHRGRGSAREHAEDGRARGREPLRAAGRSTPSSATCAARVCSAGPSSWPTAPRRSPWTRSAWRPWWPT